MATKIVTKLGEQLLKAMAEKPLVLGESELSKSLDDILSDIAPKSKSLLKQIDRLKSSFNSILGTLKAPPSYEMLKKLIAEVVKKAKKCDQDQSYWYDRIKLLIEERDEQIKKETERAIEINDELRKQSIAELNEFLERWEALEQEARLLAQAQLIAVQQAELYGLLEEREELREQIRLEDNYFNILNQQVLDSGLLQTIQASHPEIPLQDIRNAYDRYWSDPEIRTKKEFNRFAESLGISGDEINIAIHKHDIADKIQDTRGSKTRSDALRTKEAHLDSTFVDGLLKIVAELEKLGSLDPRIQKEFFDAHKDLLVKCGPKTFGDVFERKAERAIAIARELVGISQPKDAAEQSKKADLEKEHEGLLSDLHGLKKLISVVQEEFKEGRDEVKKMLDKVAEVEERIVAGMSLSQPPESPQKKEAVREAVAAEAPERVRGLEEELRLANEKVAQLNREIDDLEIEISITDEGDVKTLSGIKQQKAEKDDLLKSAKTERDNLELQVKSLQSNPGETPKHQQQSASVMSPETAHPKPSWINHLSNPNPVSDLPKKLPDPNPVSDLPKKLPDPNLDPGSGSSKPHM